MLKISWFEFFLRGIPEEFLVVLAIHVFSKTGIDLKKYLLSGSILWVLAYSIRLLPIQYGIHSILSLIAVILLVTLINKIDIIKAIRSGLMTLILVFISEGLNLLFLQGILKVDLNIVMIDPFLKTLYGMPSIIIFGAFVITYYIILSKRKELKYI